jgi:hypothetical protein
LIDGAVGSAVLVVALWSIIALRRGSKLEVAEQP